MRTNIFVVIVYAMISFSSLNSSEFSFRKYNHVKEFYFNNTEDAIKLSIKHNLPPAAILAIAGLESGYGSGYVSQITGNILSLGAFKSDKELPSLYLPYSKSSKKVLFDPKEIKKYQINDLIWKQRDKSLKRDYRPFPYAGTTKKLELLLYDNVLRKKATRACFNDFATRWITKDSNIKAFREAKIWLSSIVKKEGKAVLFTKKINIEFIYKIGGHPSSFNYRKTWPKKVKLIMMKVGLVKLTNDMHFKSMNFNTAWSNK